MLQRVIALEFQGNSGRLAATRDPTSVCEVKAKEEKLPFNAATRFWRGREGLSLDDLITEGLWPASGKKVLGDQPVLLGLSWQPTPNGIFLRYHISDIGLD